VVAAVLLVLVAAAALLLPAGGAGTVPTARADRPAPGTTLLEERPLVAFLGDSWTVGVGATDLHGYAARTAEQLGWRYRNLGVSGSGYSLPGPYDSFYAERIESVALSRPDVVVVQGSLNERRSNRTALQTAATSTLADLRAAVDPGTPILVIGASYNPGTPDATIDWINAAVARAATQAGLPFVDPAELTWTDPGDPSVWADSIHPNDRGHQLIADHLAPLLRVLVLR
jgi:lysophospholipase L1-like esterase